MNQYLICWGDLLGQIILFFHQLMVLGFCGIKPHSTCPIVWTKNCMILGATCIYWSLETKPFSKQTTTSKSKVFSSQISSLNEEKNPKYVFFISGFLARHIMAHKIHVYWYIYPHFTYIYHKHQPNVSKYSIHGWCTGGTIFGCLYNSFCFAQQHWGKDEHKGWFPTKPWFDSELLNGEKYTPGKKKRMTNWKIPIFNRKYIDSFMVEFSIVMFLFWRVFVVEIPKLGFSENWKKRFQWALGRPMFWNEMLVFWGLCPYWIILGCHYQLYMTPVKASCNLVDVDFLVLQVPKNLGSIWLRP